MSSMSRVMPQGVLPMGHPQNTSARSHPCQMPKPLQMTPFKVRNSGSTLRAYQMAELITLSLRETPATL